MTCDADQERGAPYVEVPAKRVFDTVDVEVDWHDYLARLRKTGTAFGLGDVIRPPRAAATGFQYRVTVPGTTSRIADHLIQWPKVAGASILDGSVTWTAEPISTASLRTSITGSNWPPVDGLTLGGEVSNDLRYQIKVGGGTSGQRYEIRQRVTLADSGQKEAVAVLPVED